MLPFTGGREPVQLVASLLVVVWALRLGTYLFRRILRMKVDHRFDEMRDKPLRFARFWLLQAISVAVIMLPVAYLLERSEAPGFGAWAIAGAAVWLVGLLIEAAADAQKSAFKAEDANRGRFITNRPLALLAPPQLLRRDPRLVGTVRLHRPRSSTALPSPSSSAPSSSRCSCCS